MADWTTPKTYAVGDVLTAADMNTYQRDNTPIFYWKTTSKAVTNTTTETDLFNSEFSLAAGVMGSNRRAQILAFGDGKQNSGGAAPPPRFKLKLGGTTVIDTNPSNGNLADNAARFAWWLIFDIQELNATNAQAVSVRGMIHGGDIANFATGTGSYRNTSGAGTFSITGYNSATIDMTSAQTVALTCINGSATTTDTTLQAARIAIGV